MFVTYTLIEIVGRIMICFPFLFQGFNAIFKFGTHSDRIRGRNVPASRFVLGCGLVMMFAGSGMILFDFFSALGAGLLIIFTLTAAILYHNFWSMSDPKLKREKLNSFLSNMVIIGGLLLVIANAPKQFGQL